jgi:hypothetical protein
MGPPDRLRRAVVSGVIIDVVLALDLFAGAVMPPSTRSHNKSLSAKSGYSPFFIPKNVELIQAKAEPAAD